MTGPTREPGTYRTPEGGFEVVVDVTESASWVEDVFPDEVAYLIDAERERIVAGIKAMQWQDRWTDGPDEYVLERYVLAFITGEVTS